MDPGMECATMRRVPELDALRALAAMAVLLFHLSPHQGLSAFGMTGVHLFLVLSGYLITGIVINHVGTPGFFRAFYARRILRIWPIYYLTLAFLLVLQHHLPNPPSYQGLAYYLTFTQYTWHMPGISKLVAIPPPTVHAFDHSWTLAVEEQFYLLWPIAVACVGSRRVGWTALGIIGFGVWFKTLGYEGWLLPNVFGAFALGALIAVLLNDRGRVERHRYKFSTFFLAAGSLGFAYLYWYYTVWPFGWSADRMAWRDSLQNFAYYTIHFGIVGWVATNSGRWLLAPLRMRELTYLGEISYGLYMYHLPVYWLVGGYTILLAEPWPMRVAKITLTFIVATLSYRYIESPILTLKDWFPYQPRTVGQAPMASAIPRPRLIGTRSRSVLGD